MSSENLERARPRAKRFGVEFEEERAWVAFYRRVGHDVAIAAEVLSQLEADPQMKRIHLALYLCCRESLRGDASRQARNKRIGKFVRWLCHGLFVKSTLALRRGLRRSGDLAVECLPQTSPEPAVPQVRQLKQRGEFAQAQSDFDSQVTSSSVGTPAREADAVRPGGHRSRARSAV